MRISEIEAREDFSTVLSQTLETGWSTQHGLPIRVTTEPKTSSQCFVIQPLLSALFVENPPAEIRQFLADSFRHTNVTWRALPQFLLGTALSSSAGLKMFSHRRLWVEPSLPNGEHLLVLPGNQRIRTLDFHSGTSRVFLKTGFNKATIETEVAVRGGDSTGPFPPITQQCPDGQWFEEPIIRGFTLARTPPWKPRGKYEVEAKNTLKAWSQTSAETVAASSYVERIASELLDQMTRFNETFPNAGIRWGKAVDALSCCATKAQQVTLVRSHGDFQPGNILIEANTDRVMLIDWEYSAVRSLLYDTVVYDVGLRSTRGLAERMSQHQFSHTDMAVALLEEMSRLLSENLSGNYIAPTLSVRWLEQELAGVINHLK